MRCRAYNRNGRSYKGAVLMCKSKWDDVKDKLLLVEAYARDGLIEE
ncbi:hypothetical protein [Clostridium sp.]